MKCLPSDWKRLQENKYGCRKLTGNTPRFLEYFGSLVQRFLHTAILNEDKVLGTRLQMIGFLSNVWHLINQYSKTLFIAGDRRA